MCTTTNRTQTPSKEKLRQIVKPTVAGPPPGLFPPAFTLLDNNTEEDSILRQEFDVARAQNKFKNLPFALIDYTGSKPFYLGHNDKKQTFIASMAKIGVLFAALWLRKTARENARKSKANTLDEVLNELAAKWLVEVKPFPDRFKKNVVPSKTWPPNLKNIFDGRKENNGEWKLDFKTDHNFKLPDRRDSLKSLEVFAEMSEKTAALKASKRSAINPLGFRDRLELMTSWSDNMAAASCVNALGYQFINGCLEHAGLYNRNKTTGGGLWMSLNYDGGLDGIDFQQTTAQGGTAQVVANVMWLAATKKLIDQEASEDWLMMTDKQTFTDQPNPIPSNSTTIIGEKLFREEHLNIKKLNSKIGIYYETNTVNGQQVDSNFHYSDVANIIQNDIGLVKYVIAICFSGTNDRPARVLKDLAFELATIIESEHI